MEKTVIRREGTFTRDLRDFWYFIQNVMRFCVWVWTHKPYQILKTGKRKEPYSNT